LFINSNDGYLISIDRYSTKYEKHAKILTSVVYRSLFCVLNVEFCPLNLHTERFICFKPRLNAGKDGEERKAGSKAVQSSIFLKKRADRSRLVALTINGITNFQLIVAAV
jgi:hypothetical protein